MTSFCNQLPPWASVGHFDTQGHYSKEAIVVVEPKLWPTGSTISYSFLDGSDQYKDLLKAAFAEYTRYASLDFRHYRDGDPSAKIRITFASTTQSDSVTCPIGIDALRMLGGVPTIDLGSIANHPPEQGLPIALHAVGHVLGLVHEEGEHHSNFPFYDKQSIMRNDTPNVGLSDSDKAWLSVNYPGKSATDDKMTWTLARSLGVLKCPSDTTVSILMASDASRKRELYADFINTNYDHPHATEIGRNLESGDLKFPAVNFAVFGSGGSSVGRSLAAPSTEPPLEHTDPQDIEHDAAITAVMHPQFRVAVANMIKAKLRAKGQLKDNSDEVEIQNNIFALLPLGLDLLTKGIGALTGLGQSGIPLDYSRSGPSNPSLAQSGIRDILYRQYPGIVSSGIYPVGASPGLSHGEQQRMFGLVNTMLKNPMFEEATGNLIKTRLYDLRKSPNDPIGSRIPKSPRKAPKGWSDRREDMRYDYYWTGDDSVKGNLATSYGLRSAEPLLSRNGDVLFIFTSGGKYYVWNGIEGSVCEILQPRDLGDIYERIDRYDGFLGRLEMKEL